MGLKADLDAEVAKIFQESWDVEETEDVPEAEDVLLGSNHAKRLEQATVLYADLSYSTKLVDGFEWGFAAEIYKAFLHCSAKIIRDEGGEITAYDGDRIMAIFVGSSKNTSAVRSALKINYARIYIINPAIKKQYSGANYEVKHVVGIDVSELRAARTGVRGDNDLVWVGRAANHAAKLSSLSPEFPTWITEDVHKCLHSSARLSEANSMWEARLWTEMQSKRVYRSSYWWMID
jgi:class 3 adenylate cyclase